MHDISEEQIRVRAYELWELAGRPFVNDDRFWREADGSLNFCKPATKCERRNEMGQRSEGALVLILDGVNELVLARLPTPGLDVGNCRPRIKRCVDFDGVESLQVVLEPIGLWHGGIRRLSPFPVTPAGASHLD
jgi:hypothetical protein